MKISCNKRKRQQIGMLGRSSGNHDWLLANASACVSCDFRLRIQRNRLNGNRALRCQLLLAVHYWRDTICLCAFYIVLESVRQWLLSYVFLTFIIDCHACDLECSLDSRVQLSVVYKQVVTVVAVNVAMLVSCGSDNIWFICQKEMHIAHLRSFVLYYYYYYYGYLFINH